MPRKIFVSDVGGEPSGFVVAAVCALLSLVAAIFVAVDLPTMTSFRDIAAPSLLSVAFGLIGALTAICTLHALHRDGPHSEH